MSLDFYDRIVSLIGKDPIDPVVRAFVADLEDRPVSAGFLHVFPKLGFSLVCRGKIVAGAQFFLSSDDSKSSWITPYAGVLPGGISRGDSRVEIEMKLRKRPYRTDVYGVVNEDRYDVSPLVLVASFRSESDLVDSIIVGLEPDD